MKSSLVAAQHCSITDDTMATFSDLTTPEGLKHLDEFLLHRSYIDGCDCRMCVSCVYLAASGANFIFCAAATKPPGTT